MKLTKTLVEGAMPRARRYRLNDSLVPGLSLLVMPSGSRTYYLRHRVDGRQRDLKLGTPVELSPDDARLLTRHSGAPHRIAPLGFAAHTTGPGSGRGIPL